MGRLWYVPFKKHVDPVSMDKNWTSIEDYLNNLELKEEGAVGGGEKTVTAGAPSANEGSNGDWRYTDDFIYVKEDGAWIQVFARYTDAEADTRAALQDHDHTTPIATHTAVSGAHHAVYTDAEAAAKIAADDLYVQNAGDTVGPITVDQSSSSGAVPVIVLNQADVDEDFFKFIGISDTDVDRALVDAVNFTTPGTIQGWLKINIQDDQSTDPIADGDYYIPFYSAPSA